MNEIEIKAHGKIFRLTNLHNGNKYDRALKDAGAHASEEKKLAHYDKYAGYIQDEEGKKVENGVFWKLYMQEMAMKEILERDEAIENSNYGKLIIQTNQVHFRLIKLVLVRSFNPSKGFEEELGRFQLDSLITCFKVCTKSQEDIDLVSNLIDYKDKRNRLAHKMVGPKKLTVEDSRKAYKLGEKILKYLIDAINEKSMIKEIKKTDKISDFPDAYNSLIETVKSLQKKVSELEHKIELLKKD